MRKFLFLPASREKGGIAIMMAVLLFSGVLLGCAALTIDIGKISAERRLLQNGADAVALSVAKDCAKVGSCLPAGNPSETLANANAGADGFTKIGRTDGNPAAICGTGPGLPACPPLESHMRDCVEPATGAMPDTWVRTYTTTQNSADPTDTILPYSFAQTLVGGTGHQVQACAQAGITAGYDEKMVLPLTQSLCAWEAATDDGTDFPPLPPYSTSPDLPADKNPSVQVPAEIDPDQVAKIVVMTDPTGGPADCGKNGGPAGHYTAGNFGWLDEVAGCRAVSLGGTVGGTGGVPASTECSDILPQEVGKIVYIPITDGSTGTGQGTVYDVAGVAAFYLAGVDFEGSAASKLFNGFDPEVHDPAVGSKVLLGCDETTQGCLWGWYLEPLLPAGTAFPGGNPYGPSTISLLG